MSVTKRIRYEVLKRDNHTCRYCGDAAPDAKLTVDHVTPVALGGSDDPGNLVAACRDCNAGKASTSPDAALLEDVKQEQLSLAQNLEGAYRVIVERIDDRNDYLAEFHDECPFQLQAGWEPTLRRWHDMGVPVEIPVEAARIAFGKKHIRRYDDVFSYMCGVVWNQVTASVDASTDATALEQHVYSDHDIDQIRYEAYRMGWDGRERYRQQCAEAEGAA